MTASVAVGITQGSQTLASLVPWHLQLYPPSQSNWGQWHPPAQMFKSWLTRGEKAGLGWKADEHLSFPTDLRPDFPAAASCRNTNAGVPGGPHHGQTQVQTRASPGVSWCQEGNQIRSGTGFFFYPVKRGRTFFVAHQSRLLNRRMINELCLCRKPPAVSELRKDSSERWVCLILSTKFRYLNE